MKATLAGRTVAEVPTTWRDRTAGQSNFKLRQWLPHYLRWYTVAFRGPCGGCSGASPAGYGFVASCPARQQPVGWVARTPERLVEDRLWRPAARPGTIASLSGEPWASMSPRVSVGDGTMISDRSLGTPAGSGSVSASIVKARVSSARST